MAFGVGTTYEIIKQPNGKYARYSRISDDFTHVNMAQGEAVDLVKHGGTTWNVALLAVAKAKQNPGRWNQVRAIIRHVHGRQAIVQLDKRLAGSATARRPSRRRHGATS